MWASTGPCSRSPQRCRCSPVCCSVRWQRSLESVWYDQSGHTARFLALANNGAGARLVAGRSGAHAQRSGCIRRRLRPTPSQPGTARAGGDAGGVGARAAGHAAHGAVKERLIDYVAVCLANPDVPSPVLSLVGAPGGGKSTLVRQLAAAPRAGVRLVAVWRAGLGGGAARRPLGSTQTDRRGTAARRRPQSGVRPRRGRSRRRRRGAARGARPGSRRRLPRI